MSGDMLGQVVDLLGLGPQAKYSTNGWHTSVVPSATVAPRYAMPVPNTMSSGGGSTEPAMFGQLAAALLGGPTPAAANSAALTSSVSTPTTIDKAATSTNPNAPGNSIATPDAENAVPSMAPAAASSGTASNAAAAPPGSMGDGSMADELAALGPLGALLGLGSPAIESSSGPAPSAAPAPAEDVSSSAASAPAPTTAEDAVQSSSAAAAPAPTSTQGDLMGALGLGGVLAFGDNHVHESPSAVSTIPGSAAAKSGAARRQAPEGPPGGEGHPDPVAEAMATAIPDMDFHDDMASILYMASYAVPEPTHAPGGEGAPSQDSQAPSEDSQAPSSGAPSSGEGSVSGAPVDKTNQEPSNEGSSQEKNPYEGSFKKSAKADHAASPPKFEQRQAPAAAPSDAHPAASANAKPSNAYQVLSEADTASSRAAVAAPSGYGHNNVSTTHVLSTSVIAKTITITVVPLYTATSSSQHAPVWPHNISNLTYTSSANISRPTAIAPTNASKPTTVPTDSSAASVSVFMGSIAIGLVFSIMCLI